MSFTMSTLSKTFTDHLKTLDARGTICVAAASPQTSFGRNPHVITAGRLDRDYNSTVATIGERVTRARGGRTKKISGTSISAAIISGLAACAKAADPKVDRLRFIEMLNQL